MSEILKLSQVLSSVDKYNIQGELFLPRDEEWEANTRCAVLTTDDEDDPENPPFARQHGLFSALSMDEVSQIVMNAKLQDASVSNSKLIEAFLFYYDNDAFIDFSDAKRQG